MSARRVILAMLCIGLFYAPAAAGDFTHFESSHVHPLALSGSGERIYAVNTPDARLAIFTIDDEGAVTFHGDVPVGLEPVSLAIRPDTDEVWVANHLSDSISVVDGVAGRLIATLAVGDEPTDVAFAGGRAFVSLAGREDRVVVYDAVSRQRVATIEIFGSDPRALAVSPDGMEVYLVVLESGSATTAVAAADVAAAGGPPAPSPPRDEGLENEAPLVSLIVQRDRDTGLWLDESGGDWSNRIDYDVVDLDLFTIDAATAEVVDTASYVGTTLFDVVTHPVTGDLWVANTDARNLVRFEPNLRGHLVQTRISVVRSGGAQSVIDLNPHIDYSVSPGPADEVARSLAQPGDGEFDSAGSRFYVAAFGSAKVAVLDGVTGAILARIDVPDGPSGLALDEARQQLYVMSRMDNSIAVVDTKSGLQRSLVGLAGPSFFDPSPSAIREGRRFLYDAQLSSGHGDISCATCHVFANFDGIAWDLGDPQGGFVFYEDADWVDPAPEDGTPGFDPMKGPMMSQTLRGLAGGEPFHWRGDRRDFQHFNGAFDSLMGRDGPLAEADMQAFTDFIMTIDLPPNPFRMLDGSMAPLIELDFFQGALGDPFAGQQIFETVRVGGLTCRNCHHPPAGRNSQVVGIAASQEMRIPHLRNVYEKASFDFFLAPGDPPIEPTPVEQKTGFGILHDGAISLRRFLEAAEATQQPTDAQDVAAFLISFHTGTYPCVGQQETVTAANAGDPNTVAQIEMLIAQAEQARCNLIVKGTVAGEPAGYTYFSSMGGFRRDRAAQNEAIDLGAMSSSLEIGDILTYTGVPPGSGRRMGIDRDRDTCLDGDELQQGTDPANPSTVTIDGNMDGIADRCIAVPEPAAALLTLVSLATLTGIRRRLSVV